jgi:predicted nuclease of predicted toxin-antitoxin system
MIIWVDAQLSPFLADWICNELKFDAKAIRDFGLRDANDEDIFNKAKIAEAIVMTKDIDFKILQDRLGSPPKIIWLTCGNTSNRRLKEILISHLHDAIELLNSGDSIVEISGD